MTSSIRTLDKGHYLAPDYETIDLGEVLVSKTKYANPTKTGEWHRHEASMISMVLHGGNVESRKSREIERKHGSIDFYYPHEIHKNDYKIFPSTHLGLEIDNKLLNKHNLKDSDLEKGINYAVDADLIFLQIYREALLKDELSKNSIELSILSIIQNSAFKEPSYSPPKWVKFVESILHDRWSENVALHELAMESNVHPITISKYFKKYFHCTLGQYMRKLKVRHALVYLKSGKYTLTETAHICGFSDQSHFTRVFKMTTGFLPKDFLKI